MSTQYIQWNKKYYEELGEEDENGFLDYIYRYFVYSFYLPNKEVIRLRQYTDTIETCNLFVYGDYLKKQISEGPPEQVTYIAATVNFIRVKEGVIKFDYFNHCYLPLDLKKLSSNSIDFSFVEMTGEEEHS